MRKSSRIPFQMPGRAAGKGRRPHFPEQQNCRNGKKHPPLVLGNFILPYGKSLWISFSQVSNFILHPVTIFIVWQPIIYIFFMILHCFEQIMQFRYFVPAAAYSKDKYRLLFRESRVPAFFPVSLPGVSPTQESPSVAISGRLSRIRRGLSCCCGLVLRDCNKGTSSRCALRAPRLAAQCAKPPCAGGWHTGV